MWQLDGNRNTNTHSLILVTQKNCENASKPLTLAFQSRMKHCLRLTIWFRTFYQLSESYGFYPRKELSKILRINDEWLSQMLISHTLKSILTFAQPPERRVQTEGDNGGFTDSARYNHKRWNGFKEHCYKLIIFAMIYDAPRSSTSCHRVLK